jgi:hypothetical protein
MQSAEKIDISEEYIASIFRSEEYAKQETSVKKASSSASKAESVDLQRGYTVSYPRR